MDSTDVDRQPFLLTAALPAATRLPFRRRRRQRQGDPRDFQPLAGTFDSDRLVADGRKISRDVDGCDGAGGCAAGHRRLRNQRLQCRGEHDVIVLTQGGGVADWDADAAGKDRQGIANESGHHAAVVTCDGLLQLAHKYRDRTRIQDCSLSCGGHGESREKPGT